MLTSVYMSWGASVASSFRCCLLQYGSPTIQLSHCSSQNQLLEIGWNKSEATQADVEKTLNCCGFSYVNPNGTCAAVGVCFVLQPDSEFHPKLLRFLTLTTPPPPSPQPHPPRAALTKSRCHPAPRARTSSSSTLETCCGSSAASDSSSVSRRWVCIVGGFAQSYIDSYIRIVFAQPECVSHLQIFGVWLAHRYRNLKDPRSNAGAFL